MGETMGGVVQPVQQAVGKVFQQRGDMSDLAGRPVPVLAHGGAIEYVDLIQVGALRKEVFLF
jgi:hypothetical protein